MTRRQRWIALGLCGGAALLTMVPYAMALRWFTPEGMIPSGLIGVVFDQNSYLMWIKEAADGAVLMENLYATEPQHARFFHPLFFLMGLTAKWTGWEVMTVYHVWRVGLAAALFWFIVKIAWSLFGNFRTTLVGWGLAVFGGGIGWTLPGWLIEQWSHRHHLMSADVSIVDAYVYISAFRKPLFLLGMGLMLLVVWSWWQWELTQKARHAWTALGSCLLLSVVHPYDVLTLTGIAGVRGVIGWIRQRHFGLRISDCGFLIPLAGIVVSGVIPGYAYHQWVFRADNPGFALWAEANKVLFPENPLGLALSFGVVGLWLAWGWKKGWREGKSDWLYAWAIAVAFLVYAPLRHQGKATLGWMIPIGLLATYGWEMMWQGDRLKKTLVIALTAFCTGTVWWNMGRDLLLNAQMPQDFNFFPEEQRAFDWLDRQSLKPAKVFSSFGIGSFLPRYTGHKVFLGHYSMTPYFDAKRREVRKFFQTDTPEEWRRAILSAHNITYLYFGRFERALGAYDPSQNPLWKTVYVDQGLKIFRIH